VTQNYRSLIIMDTGRLKIRVNRVACEKQLSLFCIICCVVVFIKLHVYRNITGSFFSDLGKQISDMEVYEISMPRYHEFTEWRFSKTLYSSNNIKFNLCLYQNI